ncbi:serine/threonine protein kinase [Chromatium okenii]|uniref:Serine/threonine protein kinase n=2 Tax=Chromatium okenii TaxID=61644 RepID=A0A2S7XQ52_9GAMM|nr:serine/threonine protein kinase [Chromatium okenii]
MMLLSGYQTQSLLYESANSEIYRAIKAADGQKVILKVLKQNYPTPSEIARYKQEYELTSQLDLDGVIKTYGLEKHQNTFIIIVEDFGGTSLSELLSDRDLSLVDFLLLAIKIANSLVQLNANHIIHKDINPANIVFCPDTAQLKIIDFGISTKFTKENSIFRNANLLEGTLAYISPEQTGRMNKSLDYRTDFYSLGVTFYELLTKKLPFSAQDELELVHCHLAKEAAYLTDLDPLIPVAVSNIVRKLMAKNADDRYQNALGIKADLERCLAQLQATGRIENFELATQDFSDKFQIPQKLYGRESEIETLLTAFERVSHPKDAVPSSELMLIAGYSGIGKSALVREIYKPITEKRGYFISGKFDQFQRNIPYSAVVQALGELIKNLLTESLPELEQWRKKLLSALGINAQVIIDVIPELELILGKQPPVPELGANEAQNRFNFVVKNFTQVFAQPEHPLVLFLDDLQWADSASLKFMQLLMSGEIRCLFLIGAYRDNEVFPAHPLVLTIDEIAKNGSIINRVILSALDLATSSQLICDALKTGAEEVTQLTEMVLLKTGGNPFFLNEFLNALYAEDFLSFDRTSLRWVWDFQAIENRNFTDNIVELMVSKIKKLPLKTQAILKISAAIGNQFDLSLVSAFEATELRELVNHLDVAVSENLVMPLNTREYIELSLLNTPNYLLPEYKFVHDRIQQAAYSFIPDDQRHVVHYQLGQILLKTIPPSAREEKIFELVNQLNQGTVLITEQTEKYLLAQLNLIAGQKARNSSAYQAARDYATLGLSLLGEHPWHEHYEISLAFHELQAELAFLCTDFDQMEYFIDCVITEARSVLDAVKVYIIRIQANAARNRIQKALDVGQEILQRFNITFPVFPTTYDVQKAIAENQALLDKDVADLSNLPVMTDKEKLAIIEIGNRIMPAAFNAGSLLFFLIGSLTVKLSIQSGNAPSSCFSYSTYGTILCNFSQDVKTAIKFGQLALNVLSKFNAMPVKASVLTVVALFILHRNNHIRDTAAVLQEAYTTALETGDLEYSGYSAYGYCLARFWSGQPLADVQQETGAYVTQLAKMNQLTTANYCRIYLQAIQNLLGFSKSPVLFSGEVLQESEILPQLLEQKDLVGVYFFYLYKLVLCFLFEDIEQAQNYAAEGRRNLMSGAGLVTQGVFYFYDSLVILAKLKPNASGAEEALSLVEDNQTILQQHWASHAPMNYQHKIDLVTAEKYRVLGRALDAMEFYDRAIALARENDYINDVAIAYELAAKFYLSIDRTMIAKTYMQEAYYFYELWGATAKVNHLRNNYSGLVTAKNYNYRFEKNSTPHTQSALHTQSAFNNSLDLASVMKASQAITSEIVLENLLQTLMKILLENAGAESGCLLLQLQREHLEVAIHAQDGVFVVFPKQELIQVAPVSVLNFVVRTKTGIILDEAIATKNNFHQDDYIQSVKPLSMLCHPLLNQNELVGVVYLENKMTAGVFTQERVELLQLISGEAAIAIINATLYQEKQQYALTLEEKVNERTLELQKANDELLKLAHLDGLTRIANRRSFDSYLATEWERHFRSQEPLALIMIDIDFFKLYNDSYGHQGGDDCLIQVAQTLAKVPQRAADFVARYGGEEFAVVLPNTDAQGALVIAENLNKQINLLALPHKASKVSDHVTLSLGVASLIPCVNFNAERLIADADEALYRAKNQGRNQASF